MGRGPEHGVVFVIDRLFHGRVDGLMAISGEPLETIPMSVGTR